MQIPDSHTVEIWILSAVFGAAVGWTTLRLTVSKTAKDLNFVGGKVRTLEAARIEDRIDFVLALYDVAPDDKKKREVLELLRVHRRRA